MEHTLEPWYSVGPYVKKQRQHDTVLVAACNHPISPDEEEANAARIVACVNACAGMEDPLVEITSLRKRLDRCERRLALHCGTPEERDEEKARVDEVFRILDEGNA
jgi:hypothetical protein